MNIDHTKLENIITGLLDDVKGMFSSSSVAIGEVKGAVIRIEVLDAEEAEDQDVKLSDSNKCIEE